MQDSIVKDRNSLSRQQKESIAILGLGTFLEFFDLYLYVHMAVLLNELFFPASSPTTVKLLAATAFCSTYILRPVGGFVIGRIGDSVGRKFTILLTTFIMAFTCITMAIVPTYAEIGIFATAVVIVCRMLQGFSSMGESMGAQVYLSELLKAPYKVMAGGMTGVAAHVGGFFALTVASFVLSSNLNWRIVFLVGAFIAVFGVFARTRLRETPEFADYKRRMKKKLEKYKNELKRTNVVFRKEKINKKTILAYFFTELYSPVCFYITYMYLGDFMKDLFGMTATQVINQNLIVAAFVVSWALGTVFLVKKNHPVVVALCNLLLFFVFLPFIPYWLNNVSGLFSLFCLRCLIISLCVATGGTLDAVLLKYLPISKRFTAAGLAYGVAFPLGFVVSSFGLIPLKNYFGHYGLWILFIPILAGYLWSLLYIRKIEIESGCYYNYPNADPVIEEESYSYELLGDEYKNYNLRCKYSRKLLAKLNAMNEKSSEKVDIKLIEKAILFAKKWHDGQRRKTGEPFYFHPLAVAEMVSEYSFKTIPIVAAILHDVVEDSACSVKVIEEVFNTRIAILVERLTKHFEDRKMSVQEAMKKLVNSADCDALLIKGLDRLHNLQTIHGMEKLKRKKIALATIYEIATTAAYAVDKLNINNKLELEEKLFSHSNDIMKEKV